jgi:hypothetical protein
LVYTADPSTGAPGLAVASGPLTGFGSDVNIGTHLNMDGTRTNIDLLTFGTGSITLTSVDPPNIFQFNPATCVARISGTGPYTVTNSTGAYRGASGSGTFTVVGAIVYGRTAQGCSFEPSGPPVVVVIATGPLSIP